LYSKLSEVRSNRALQTSSSASEPPRINPLANPKSSPYNASFKFTK
jgi:hypothetical protein